MKKYNKIIIWGAGRALKNLLDETNFSIDYIVDRNQALWDKEIEGIVIKSPEIIRQEKGKILMIISAILLENEIRNDIRMMNIQADVKNRFTLMMESFSEYGEDIIVDRMFEKLKLKDISYLEIGMPTPIFGSNTYRFYEKGNRGCCIEANPDVITTLKGVRPNDYIIHCGIGTVEEEGKELNYYRFINRDALNTFDENTAKNRAEKLGIEIKDVIYIGMKSLNTIIDKELGYIPDYISLDVENYEYKVLKDFDFEKYKIKVFCIEKSQEEVVELIQSNQYVLIAQTPSNWIFILKELKQKLWN